MQSGTFIRYAKGDETASARLNAFPPELVVDKRITFHSARHFAGCSSGWVENNLKKN